MEECGGYPLGWGHPLRRLRRLTVLALPLVKVNERSGQSPPSGRIANCNRRNLCPGPRSKPQALLSTFRDNLPRSNSLNFPLGKTRNEARRFGFLMITASMQRAGSLGNHQKPETMCFISCLSLGEVQRVAPGQVIPECR